MKRRYEAVLLILSMVFGVVLAGCGRGQSFDGPLGKLEGKIAYKGKPIRIGNVTVTSDDGKFMAQGSISKEGTYFVDKAPAGKVKITISFPELPEQMKMKKMAAELPQAAPPPPAKDLNLPEVDPEQLELFKSIEKLPQKVLDTRTYQFHHEIKEGQTAHLDLPLDKLLNIQ